MDIKRNVLLNPGPATTTDSVKMAQVIPDICPREQEFGDVMEFVAKGLTEFVGALDKYTTVIFGGSGTAAVESMLSSVVGEGSVLIVNNGAYGKRMCDIASVYGMNYIEFDSSAIAAIDMCKLEQVIMDNKEKLTHLAVIHHETTTGLLNDVSKLGALCKKYNLELIVDAMSSYAGIPMDMEKMNISYLASSSNKCIQGMAGVSFVIANIESLIKTKNNKPRNLYLNLYKQYDYFKSNYQMRFTPPVQVLYALKQAIVETQRETIEARHNRYVKSCNLLWSELNRLGLKRLVDEECHSHMITTVVDPEIESFNFNDMHDYLFERGFTLYPGKISSKNTFRIANIGEINEDDMARAMKVLEEYLRKIGFIL